MKKKVENAKKLEGWGAICDCVGWTRPTVIKYGFPVYRQIAQGNRVFAYHEELQRHKRSLEQRFHKTASA